MIGLAVVASCATDGVRPFPLRDPMWTDHDQHAISDVPSRRFVSGTANMVDQTVLRPVTHALAVRTRREAANVNSVDEVPNSSWFTNRIGSHAMTPVEVARGAC